MTSELTEKKTTIRLEFLDIAKAIAIVTVLLTHSVDPTGGIPFYMKLVASFNIPLFFMACGMTSRPPKEFTGKEFLSFLGKNAFQLVMPYLLWCMIFLPFNLDSMGRILYGSCQMFISCNAKCQQMWFLPCLFLTRIAMYGILYIESRLKKNSSLVMLLIDALCFAIGFLLPDLEKGYPWCINIVFIALGIMIPAHVSNSFLKRMNEKSMGWQVGFALVSGVLLYIGNLCETPPAGFMSMCTGDYGNPFWFLFNAISGVICARSVASMLSRIDLNSRFAFVKKGLSWLGQNTVGVFVVHYAFEVTFMVGGIPKLLNVSVGNFASSLLATVITLAYSILLTLIINLVIPQLFGRRYKR